MLNDGRGHFRPLPGAMPAKPFSSDAEGLAVTPVELNGDGRPDALLAFTKQRPFYEGRWIGSAACADCDPLARTRAHAE
jgi:hypothetical protein